MKSKNRCTNSIWKQYSSGGQNRASNPQCLVLHYSSTADWCDHSAGFPICKRETVIILRLWEVGKINLVKYKVFRTVVGTYKYINVCCYCWEDKLEHLIEEHERTSESTYRQIMPMNGTT